MTDHRVSDSEFSRIHIRVKCHAQLGQSVAVIGLGISKLLKLVTRPDSYPIWISPDPIVVPRGLEVGYRFGLIESGLLKLQEPVDIIRKITPVDDDVLLEDECRVETVIPTKTATKLQDSYKTISETKENFTWQTFAQSNGRLFLICYHLPVVIKATFDPSMPFQVTWAESLIAKTRGSVSGSIQTIWIGTISLSLKDVTEEEKNFLLNTLDSMSCIPVFLDDTVAANAYYGFCKAVMWPVFHNVDQLDQIHAAWNMPTDADMMKVTSMLHRLGINQANGGPASQNGSEKGPQRGRSGADSKIQELFFSGPSLPSNPQLSTSVSMSTLSTDNKVLEWNQKELDFYRDFVHVNEIFAEVILQTARKGDVLWVHDYHLMLLPKILRDEFTKKSIDHLIKIVFFLHIPFPTSQIFRTLPQANELLQSMVNADLVGFHAFDHARHFLNATKRILGIKSVSKQGGLLTLLVQEREVVVTMSHVSIETDRFDAIMQDPETQKLANKFRQEYAGRRVILGIDVCQRLSGIALKLAGFDKLLADYNHAEKASVVLVQRNVRQGSRPDDEETTSNDSRRIVDELNAKYAENVGDKFGTGNNTDNSGNVNGRTESMGVVDYEEINSFRGLSVHERVALYLIADVLLLTPIREGLNLLPLEYIYVRRSLSRAGAVVVSEFSTCSSLLNGSLKVNPFSPQSIADSLEKALSMSSRDMEYRRQRDLPFISSHPSSSWTKEILGELAQLKVQQDAVQQAEIEQQLHKIVNISCGATLASARWQVQHNNQLYQKQHYQQHPNHQLHLVHASKHSTSSGSLTPLSPTTNKPTKQMPVQAKGLVPASRSPLSQRMQPFRFSSSSFASAYSSTQFLTRDFLYSAYHQHYYHHFAALQQQHSPNNPPVVTATQLSEVTPLVTRAHRVFILNYGGVLLHKEGFDVYLKQTLSAISGRCPTPEVMTALAALCADPLNVVALITGLTKLKLGDIFADKKFENLTLATSNGLVYSWGKNLLSASSSSSTLSAASSVNVPPNPTTNNTPAQAEGVKISNSTTSATNTSTAAISSAGQNGTQNPPLIPSGSQTNTAPTQLGTSGTGDQRNWECMDFAIDWGAVGDIAVPIITKFTFRTNGTCQTPRFPGIGWSYFGADPEYGEKQAAQLKIELEAALACFDVKVTSLIPGSIEVVPRTLNRSLILRQIYRRIQDQRGGKLPHMLVVMSAEGDSDAGLFDATYEWLQKGVSVTGHLGQCQCITVSVGKKDKSARFFLRDVQVIKSRIRKESSPKHFVYISFLFVVVVVVIVLWNVFVRWQFAFVCICVNFLCMFE
jgi:trehalose-6-phosphate synthase/trehalose-6-phosphatase